ncbi:MAG TPA: GAF domain-containing protein [Blastocatellia bacterium]|nr:GAF domain-containing protein [Blastocatellia bacterium]
MAGKAEDILSQSAKSEELQEMFQKSKAFAQELMAENQRLRYRVVQLEKEGMELPVKVTAETGQLREENKRLAEQVAFLEKKFTEIEEENKDFAMRFVEVEAQNENLLNLYVASFQLHSTLDQAEVLQCIKEILINLVGTEEFGIYLVDEESSDLLLHGFEGELVIGRGRITCGEGVEGMVAAKGEAYYSDGVGTEGEVCVCIPLKIKEHVVGVIAIHRLLGHKATLTALDHELLQLLAGQAATALVSSKLYASADRKLKTMEGFINLLRATK